MSIKVLRFIAALIFTLVLIFYACANNYTYPNSNVAAYRPKVAATLL